MSGSCTAFLPYDSKHKRLSKCKLKRNSWMVSSAEWVYHPDNELDFKTTQVVKKKPIILDKQEIDIGHSPKAKPSTSTPMNNQECSHMRLLKLDHNVPLGKKIRNKTPGCNDNFMAGDDCSFHSSDSLLSSSDGYSSNSSAFPATSAEDCPRSNQPKMVNSPSQSHKVSPDKKTDKKRKKVEKMRRRSHLTLNHSFSPTDQPKHVVKKYRDNKTGLKHTNVEEYIKLINIELDLRVKKGFPQHKYKQPRIDESNTTTEFCVNCAKKGPDTARRKGGYPNKVYIFPPRTMYETKVIHEDIIQLYKQKGIPPTYLQKSITTVHQKLVTQSVYSVSKKDTFGCVPTQHPSIGSVSQIDVSVTQSTVSLGKKLIPTNWLGTLFQPLFNSLKDMASTLVPKIDHNDSIGLQVANVASMDVEEIADSSDTDSSNLMLSSNGNNCNSTIADTLIASCRLVRNSHNEVGVSESTTVAVNADGHNQDEDSVGDDEQQNEGDLDNNDDPDDGNDNENNGPPADNYPLLSDLTIEENRYDAVFKSLKMTNDVTSANYAMASADWDSCAIISSSLNKVIHKLSHKQHSLTVSNTITRMGNDTNSKVYIKVYNNKPLHHVHVDRFFKPNHRFGDASCDLVRLNLFTNFHFGEILLENGMNFLIRLYILSADRVPMSSYITDKDGISLSILMNLAYENRAERTYYHRWSDRQKKSFCDCFERHNRFHYGKGNFRRIKFFPEGAVMWCRLLSDNIETIATDETAMLGYNATSPYCLNNYFALTDLNRVTNDDFRHFCKRVYYNGVYVANAYGFKTSFVKKPTSIVDLNDSSEVNIFCKKATQLISSNNFVLNDADFPGWLEDPHFRDYECPLIVANDIGMQFIPINHNESTIVNGYIGKHVLSKLLLRKKDEEKLMHVDHNYYCTEEEQDRYIDGNNLHVRCREDYVQLENHIEHILSCRPTAPYNAYQLMQNNAQNEGVSVETVQVPGMAADELSQVSLDTQLVQEMLANESLAEETDQPVNAFGNNVIGVNPVIPLPGTVAAAPAPGFIPLADLISETEQLVNTNLSDLNTRDHPITIYPKFDSFGFIGDVHNARVYLEVEMRGHDFTYNSFDNEDWNSLVVCEYKLKKDQCIHGGQIYNPSHVSLDFSRLNKSDTKQLNMLPDIVAAFLSPVMTSFVEDIESIKKLLSPVIFRAIVHLEEVLIKEQHRPNGNDKSRIELTFVDSYTGDENGTSFHLWPECTHQAHFQVNHSFMVIRQSERYEKLLDYLEKCITPLHNLLELGHQDVLLVSPHCKTALIWAAERLVMNLMNSFYRGSMHKRLEKYCHRNGLISVPEQCRFVLTGTDLGLDLPYGILPSLFPTSLDPANLPPQEHFARIIHSHNIFKRAYIEMRKKIEYPDIYQARTRDFWYILQTYSHPDEPNYVPGFFEVPRWDVLATLSLDNERVMVYRLLSVLVDSIEEQHTRTLLPISRKWTNQDPVLSKAPTSLQGILKFPNRLWYTGDSALPQHYWNQLSRSNDSRPVETTDELIQILFCPELPENTNRGKWRKLTSRCLYFQLWDYLHVLVQKRKELHGYDYEETTYSRRIFHLNFASTYVSNLYDDGLADQPVDMHQVDKLKCAIVYVTKPRSPKICGNVVARYVRISLRQLEQEVLHQSTQTSEFDGVYNFDFSIPPQYGTIRKSITSKKTGKTKGTIKGFSGTLQPSSQDSSLLRLITLRVYLIVMTKRCISGRDWSTEVGNEKGIRAEMFSYPIFGKCPFSCLFDSFPQFSQHFVNIDRDYNFDWSTNHRSWNPNGNDKYFAIWMKSYIPKPAARLLLKKAISDLNISKMNRLFMFSRENGSDQSPPAELNYQFDIQTNRAETASTINNMLTFSVHQWGWSQVIELCYSVGAVTNEVVLAILKTRIMWIKHMHLICDRYRENYDRSDMETILEKFNTIYFDVERDSD